MILKIVSIGWKLSSLRRFMTHFFLYRMIMILYFIWRDIFIWATTLSKTHVKAALFYYFIPTQVYHAQMQKWFIAMKFGIFRLMISFMAGLCSTFLGALLGMSCVLVFEIWGQDRSLDTSGTCPQNPPKSWTLGKK